MAVTVEYGSKRVVVEPVLGDNPAAVCQLGRGGSGDKAVWVRLTTQDRSMPRQAVAISCPVEGLWQIRRVSDKVGVEVRFDDGSRLVIPNDRWRLMPADEPHAYVVVLSPARSYEFSVRIGRHGSPFMGFDGDGDDIETYQVFRADPDTGYFRVCVALCESRLVDPFIEHLPTEVQIADRLDRSGIEPGVSVKGVQRRLEAVRAKTGVTSNRELRDRLIASRAITPNHLALLQPSR